MMQEKILSNKKKGISLVDDSKSNFKLSALLGGDLIDVDNVIKNKDDHIQDFVIPKKDGSQRKIKAPDSQLKYLQKSIYFNLIKRYKPSDRAHGFVANRGISTNATPHVGAKSIGKIDILNFFDSISEKHLQNCLFGNKNICRYCKHYKGMLQGECNPSLYKNKNTNYKHKCEEMKAMFIPDYCEKTGYKSLFKRVIELCTLSGKTAQGFPTSPSIANIVLRGFDKHMAEYCDNLNIAYTRYADDLAFSSKELDKNELKKAVLGESSRQLWAYGFEINKNKIVFKNRSSRMKICGVVVNEVKNVMRRKVRLFRAKVHNATIKKPNETTKKYLNQLKGWASFLMSINRNKGSYYMNKLIVFEQRLINKGDGIIFHEINSASATINYSTGNQTPVTTGTSYNT